MLNSFIALDLSLRLLSVFLLGLVAARLANWGIYSWAHFSRQLGPWSPAPAGHRARSPLDHLPIIGWWRLRTEATVHGARFWLRPMLIEAIFPLAITWYYNFVVHGGTLPATMQQFAAVIQPELHGMFIGHFVLCLLMTIATFIDFDEQSIPDFVTIPGTIIGLIGASLLPGWLGLTVALTQSGALPLEMDALRPNGWEAWLNGRYGLYIAVLILCVWTFGLLDRRLILRRGWSKAWHFFWVGMFRHKWLWRAVVSIGVLMVLGVALAWWQQIPRWQYLLSSLLGLACAGGITWAVRIAASSALQKQALGFGDVTLMAMIGAYVGWQPSLMIFFIAPIMAVLIVLLQYLLTGEKAAPYGPYLCAATVGLLLGWDWLWNGWAGPVFALGSTILVIMAVCVIVMGAMLWCWRLLTELIWRDAH